jgi:hypothetical protein
MEVMEELRKFAISDDTLFLPSEIEFDEASIQIEWDPFEGYGVTDDLLKFFEGYQASS